MIKCPFCGKEYEDNMEYCPFCGSDNLELDGFKKHKEEHANTFSTYNSSATSSTNVVIRNVLFGYYKCPIEYDLDDPYERAQYKKAKNRTIIIICGMILGLLLQVSFLTLTFTLKHFYVGLLYSSVFVPFAVYCVFLLRIVSGKKKDIAYLKYKVEKLGGSVGNFEEDRGYLEYELYGAHHRIELPRYRGHRPINY